MNIKKYPIIGKYGEYEIRVKKSSYRDLWLTYEFSIYYKKEKTFLGIKYKKWVRLKSKKYGERDMSSQNYDFVKISKEVVNEYDDWLDSEYEKDRLIEEKLKDFNSWDGKL